jgi:RimJ/RimL family protein N-acetyltransferase
VTTSPTSRQINADSSRHDPIITITGEKVALGPPHRGIVPLLSKWDNDLSLSILSGDPARSHPPEAAEQDYERYVAGGQREWIFFVIYERVGLRPIGATGLSHIKQTHRTAELGISIGEADCWGKGYGTEATLLLLDYAFTVLGLHNVMLDVVSYNERAIRTYHRAGFREIGRRRQSYRLGGRVYDQVFMDCVASDFSSPLKPVLERP